MNKYIYTCIRVYAVINNVFCYCVNISVITFNIADPTADIDASVIDDVDVDAVDTFVAADDTACLLDSIRILR